MAKRIFASSMLILVVLYLFVFSSSAYEWRTYTVGDGLKDNVVRTIAVDDQAGTIWFGTKSGLSCFDGARWKSYLDGYDVRAILVESKGKIWFGTNQGVFLKIGDNMTHVLPDLFVQDIAMDGQGVKWFGTRAGIRSTLDGATWEDYHEIELGLAKNFAQQLSQAGISGLEFVRTNVTSIDIDKNDVKWLATHVIFQQGEHQLVVSGVGLFDNLKWELLGPTIEVNVSAITSVTLDENDNLWYSRWGRGAFFWDGKKIHHYFSQDVNQDGIWLGEYKIITVQDLDGDGQKEVVTTVVAGYDLQPRGIRVYDLAGEKRWQYLVGPYVSPGRLAVGDVTGDGLPEVVVGGGSPFNGSTANGTDDAHGYLFILDSSGRNLWGNGTSEPLTHPGGEIPRVALADVDRDGVNDIIGFINTNLAYVREGNLGGIIVTDGYGNQKGRFKHRRPILFGSVADLNNDGWLEIVAINDQGLLIILDHTLSLIHEQQFEQETRLVAIANLYGDDYPEMLLLSKGRLFVLDSKWTQGRLSTLWEYKGFEGMVDVLLSDVEQGGATEILIKDEVGRVHVLSYDAEKESSLKAQDTGRRYGDFYHIPSDLVVKLD